MAIPILLTIMRGVMASQGRKGGMGELLSGPMEEQAQTFDEDDIKIEKLVFKPTKDPTGAIEDAAKLGLIKAAEYVLEKANRTIPHERGDLQDSGHVSVNDDGTRAAITYDSPYAVRQHEELTWHHNDGRRAKWLEKTLVEEADTVRQIIAEEIRKVTR